MMFDEGLALKKLTSQNDPFSERRVFIQELPNPHMNQTWDTPNINDTLIETYSIALDETGSWCFPAATGLWRIWMNFSPAEEYSGVTLQRNDIKAFVQNAGMDNLYLQQVNLQVSGKVLCTRKEYCQDIPIVLREVGMSDTPLEFQTRVKSDGTFKFDLVKPGKWDISVVSPKFCFQETEMRIKLGDKRSVTDV
jgi:hypothetical protein